MAVPGATILLTRAIRALAGRCLGAGPGWQELAWGPGRGHWPSGEVKTLPAGIQGMVFSFSNLLIQAAVNSLGPDAMAASAAAFAIEVNVYCVLNAFAQATTTFVSQNYGAGNLPRCFQITKVGMGLDIAFTVMIAAVTAAAAAVIIAIMLMFLLILFILRSSIL